ncbi:SpdA protein [Streptodolium elevatio]|uniref:SpdA protein n=1 Tax=Streptodolium elevatio TaxID=3157996 RepID=A0ABV3DA80_9ACTN
MRAPGARDAPFGQEGTLRAVTWIMGAVVGLTFLFGFGNVWTLALRLGVPPWVAPLVAPAVDLSVLGLLLAVRHLALHGADPNQLRPARRLLVFSSVMTLALNVADPLIARQYGRAAFDAVGPLLLIGWAEVGPGLLQALSGVAGVDGNLEGQYVTQEEPTTDLKIEAARPQAVDLSVGVEQDHPEGRLLRRAREEDARHWAEHRRPISAESLRKQLHIGAARSRLLVAMIRAEASDSTVRSL